MTDSRARERVFDGIAVSPGITIGPAYVHAREAIEVEERILEPELVDQEVASLHEAIERSERDLNKIIAVTREKLGEDSADIFEAQRLMLFDDAVRGEAERCIRRDRFEASYALHRVMQRHRKILEASGNDYFRERAHDLQDVEDRIIRHLRRGRLISAVDPSHIVVSENLTAADIILFSRRGILGCAMDYGGLTSHVSIMARSLGVPAVVSLHGLAGSIATGDLLVLDGLRGRVVVNPDDATLDAYRRRKDRFERLRAEEKSLVHLEPETVDGHRVRLEANLELRDEVSFVAEYGAQGIGLFRTEMLFLVEGRLSVSEEDQFRIYQAVVSAVAPAPVTLRVLDLGGDKLLPVAHREHNPFLGWRGIRVLLDKPDLLMPQLKAILRASAFGNVRILIPMVTDVGEVRQVRALLARAREELRSEGRAFADNVPVGVMVEVPSVALLADRFAAESDFFSIGTNDLTQYALAVDRGNDLVSKLFRDLHPAVLHLVRKTLEAARRRGIPVSVCGELAANLRAVPILVGMGVDALSMSPVYLPGVKRVIRSMSKEEGQLLAREALESDDADEVAARLDRWLEEHGCGVPFLVDSRNGH